MFSHEKLEVYQRSTEWLAFSASLIRAVPKGNADLVNQLRRASLSIPLNIAEGAGKTGKLDKRRFYAIARGSTLECVAVLDALGILQVIQADMLREGKEILHDVASMLSALVLRFE